MSRYVILCNIMSCHVMFISSTSRPVPSRAVPSRPVPSSPVPPRPAASRRAPSRPVMICCVMSCQWFINPSTQRTCANTSCVCTCKSASAWQGPAHFSIENRWQERPSPAHRRKTQGLGKMRAPYVFSARATHNARCFSEGLYLIGKVNG